MNGKILPCIFLPLTVAWYLILLGTTWPWAPSWHVKSFKVEFAYLEFQVGLWQTCTQIDTGEVYVAPGRDTTVTRCSYNYELINWYRAFKGPYKETFKHGIGMGEHMYYWEYTLVVWDVKVTVSFLLKCMYLMGAAYVVGMATLVTHVIWWGLRACRVAARILPFLSACLGLITGVLVVACIAFILVSGRNDNMGLQLTDGQYTFGSQEMLQDFPNGWVIWFTLVVGIVWIIQAFISFICGFFVSNVTYEMSPPGKGGDTTQLSQV